MMIRSIIHAIKLKFSKNYRIRVELRNQMTKDCIGIQRMDAPTGQIFTLRMPS